MNDIIKYVISPLLSYEELLNFSLMNKYAYNLLYEIVKNRRNQIISDIKQLFPEIVIDVIGRNRLLFMKRKIEMVYAKRDRTSVKTELKDLGTCYGILIRPNKTKTAFIKIEGTLAYCDHRGKERLFDQILIHQRFKYSENRYTEKFKLSSNYSWICYRNNTRKQKEDRKNKKYY